MSFFKRIRFPSAVLVGLLLMAGTIRSAHAQEYRVWKTDGLVRAVTVSGGTVYVAGEFNTIFNQNGTPYARAHAAAIDAGSGAILDWAPNPNGRVDALAVGDGVVYLGGDFTNCGGQARASIAAVDAVTALATSWNPGTVRSAPHTETFVRDLLLANGVLYAAGEFTSIGGQPRAHVAAVDLTTGHATAWAPSVSRLVDGMLALLVCDIQSRNGIVYLAGWFDHVAGQPRRGIAAVDATSAALFSWDPAPNDNCEVVAFDGDRVLLGGWFTTLRGVPRNHIGAVDATTAAVTSFDPNANTPIFTLHMRPYSVFVGGYGVQPADRLSELRTSTGSETGFSPGTFYFMSYANNIAYSGATLWAGGADDPSPPGGDFSPAVVAFDFPTTEVDAVPGGTELSLAPSTPHPARAEARIRFTLPEAGSVSLRIYDLKGRRVAAPIDRAWREAGAHEVRVRTEGWQPGCYFYRLDTGGRSATRKMVVAP